MTGKIEIYKCEKCGNIVEVFATGAGTLVCCGENMVLQEENTMCIQGFFRRVTRPRRFSQQTQKLCTQGRTAIFTVTGSRNFRNRAD